MKVLVTIQHPAHVHFFKNIITELEDIGHDLTIVARKGEYIERLLAAYNIDYTILAGQAQTLPELMKIQMKYEYNIFKKSKSFEPDVLAAIGEPSITHVGKYLGIPSLIFTDTEQAKLQNKITFPFADTIYTPDAYTENIGQKQIRYPGYHELAYLHPDRFTPDPGVFDNVGINSNERFVILRTVAWSALHDEGDSGFDSIIEIVNEIEEQGVRVLITAEDDLPKSLKKYQISIDPHRIHNLQYYADLFLGESATMATESAVLGTPSFFVSTATLGYLEELEHEYGLVSNFSGDRRQINAMNAAISILENYDQELWDERRQNMLEDKIDTTDFIVDRITQTLK
jgi:predicted glycosyltransferase